MQGYSKSIANGLELLQSYTKPLICMSVYTAICILYIAI